MTLAVGETSQTRINAEIRRNEQRVGVLETDLAALSAKFVEGSGVLTYGGTPAGLLPVEQVFRLNTDLAGANSTTTQGVFGVGCTLAASTVYAFEIVATLTKSAGTTSHNISLGYGGTATFNASSYLTIHSAVQRPPGSSTSALILHREALTSLVMLSTITAASNQFRWQVRGTLSVNAGGTFIPQYTLSAAPGGAYSTEQGSFIRIYPLGPSGANTNIGPWA